MMSNMDDLGFDMSIEETPIPLSTKRDFTTRETSPRPMTDRPQYSKVDRVPHSPNFGIFSERKEPRSKFDDCKVLEEETQDNFLADRFNKYRDRTTSVKRQRDPSGWE